MIYVRWKTAESKCETRCDSCVVTDLGRTVVCFDSDGGVIRTVKSESLIKIAGSPLELSQSVIQPNLALNPHTRNTSLQEMWREDFDASQKG